MKTKPISYLGAILIALVCNLANAQPSATASALWITDCSQSSFLNTTGSIGTSNFNNANLGIYTQNSGNLILSGAQVNTSHDPGTSNVCLAHLYYNVHLQSSPAGAFTSIDLPLFESCNGSNQFPSDGSSCSAGDQKWQRFFSNVDLTAFAPGNYVLEVYFDAQINNSAPAACNSTLPVNNSGNNYKASFSIQSPNLSSTNPSSCFGNQGSITIGGLVAGASYQLSYTDDGTAVGPNTYVTNGSGQLIITGLNKGFYSNFSLEINGCTTNLFTGIILSDPIFVPTFDPIPPFCAGTTAPTLPLTSKNGIHGTWSPATVDNQNSATYTFTPDVNQCGVQVTLPITVTQRTVPAFSFGTSLSICAGGTVPPLPPTSQNGIAGVWTPAVVDDQNSATYIFTPSGTQCASIASFSVFVSPNVVPTFSFGTGITICDGASVPSLPGTSVNGIIGTWSPSTIDNHNTGVYTFTPFAGQCASPIVLNVTVNPNVTPTFGFGTSLSVCSSGSVPTLPSTSQNGITGTWNPVAIDNQNSAVYTFTPDPGQCATSASLTVTVEPNAVPTFSFGTILSICDGGAVPILTGTSIEGITGIWTPAVVDNTINGTYVFTPTAGQCATTTTFTVIVSPNITPTFNFGTSLTICAGASVPLLVQTSVNGVIGSWSPSTVSSQLSGTYTFTPFPGQCATAAIFNVVVNPNVTPTFSFGTSLSVCAGGTVPPLPLVSQNGITGTWSPSSVSNQTSGTYTFTPTPGQCATTTSFAVTVNPNITPTFSFGTSLTICAGGTVPPLPNSSQNGITGSWSPSSVDDQNTGTYTFTPDPGQCATTASFAVTVNPNITPTFSFGTTLTICAGGNVPSLPNTSQNGIAGTWSPATADNQNSAIYTFTPNGGQCVTGPVTFDVTVTANAIPTFSFGNSLTICAGGTVPALPATSDNGITGVWDPSVVSNQVSGTYTFTVAGQCVTPFVYTVTVNPIVKPTFSFGTFQSICTGTTVPVLATTSANGITGTWNPAVVDNTVNGTYVFTPDPGQCTDTTSFKLEVNAVPTTSIAEDTAVYDGAFIPSYNFITSPGAATNWTNSNPSIGVGVSGTGTVPSFTATNRTDQDIIGTITATPVIGGCSGTTQSYTIKVMPLNKDVFVPNVFTPNGDGKNDVLYVYGNYIDKLEMHIFNQWGQQIAVINDKTQGWDGKHKGTAQPIGVYVYVLKAELSTGRTVNLKGSITLLR
jgi:gliding motility-associated-like protein